MNKDYKKKETKWNIINLDKYKQGVKTYQCLCCKTIYLYDSDPEIMSINPDSFCFCPHCGTEVKREGV